MNRGLAPGSAAEASRARGTSTGVRAGAWADHQSGMSAGVWVDFPSGRVPAVSHGPGRQVGPGWSEALDLLPLAQCITRVHISAMLIAYLQCANGLSAL
jgi:hypothetical protein